MPQWLNDLLTLANTLDTVMGVFIAIYAGSRLVIWFRSHWKS